MNQPQQVFAKAFGRAGNYRIPAMLVTKHGTVVACADERFFTGGDNPNRIDKVVRRSKDSGQTWEEQIVMHEEVGESKMEASAAIDPQLIYDEEQDKIIVIFSHTPARTFILNCRRSLGEDKDGNRIVRHGKEVYFLKNGMLVDKNYAPTPYLVDEKGNLTKDGNYICNIIIYNGEWKEDDTAYLMQAESTDDGLTWSTPVCINRQVKSPKWGFIGAGPGIGLQLKHGAHKGRLISPIYYNAIKFPLMLNSLCMYSDDHGKTWQKSNVPNDLRRNPFISSKFILSYSGCTTESQIVEKLDGSLLFIMRNHDSRREAAFCDSFDGGETFENFRFQPDITHPICQISAISATFQGQEAILVCHAEDKKRRALGVVQMSLDGGATFPYRKVITEGEFVYSSMAILPDGMLGILYEPCTQHETIDFVKYDLNEIFKI